MGEIDLRHSTLLTFEQLATLGRITLLWAEIDHLLDHAARYYLDVTVETWDALIGDRTLPAKVQALQRILKSRPKNEVDELSSCLVTIKDLSVLRNVVVHGLWGRKQETGEAVSVSRRHKAAVAAGDLEALERRMQWILDDVSIQTLRLLIAQDARRRPDLYSDKHT